MYVLEALDGFFSYGGRGDRKKQIGVAEVCDVGVHMFSPVLSTHHQPLLVSRAESICGRGKWS